MGNHCIDCDYCGEDLRAGGHAPRCEGPAYEVALRTYQTHQREFVEQRTQHEKAMLSVAVRLAEGKFVKDNPKPTEPKKL